MKSTGNIRSTKEILKNIMNIDIKRKQSRDYQQRMKERSREKQYYQYNCLFASSKLEKCYHQIMISDLIGKYNLQTKIIKFLIDYIKRNGSKKDWRLPYLFGLPGVGKTYISKVFLNSYMMALVKKVIFVRTTDIISKDVEEKIKQEWFNSPILALDDFCNHIINRYTLQNLFNLIDYRLNHKLPTLITSNIKLSSVGAYLYEHVKNYGVHKDICSSIEDRIVALCIPYNLKGKSIRVKEASNLLRGI